MKHHRKSWTVYSLHGRFTVSQINLEHWPLSHCRRVLDHYLWLLPQHIHPCVTPPIDALTFEFPVKVPYHLADGDAHFQIRQIDANATSRALREGFRSFCEIILETNIIERMIFGQPAFWVERVWLEEVSAVVRD